MDRAPGADAIAKARAAAHKILTGAIDPFDGAREMYSLSVAYEWERPDFDVLWAFVDFHDEEAMIDDPVRYGVESPRTRDEVAEDIAAHARGVLARWPEEA